MKTVLCFGDSNTHGQIPGKDGGRYEKEIRWPGVLKSMLGDSFDVIEEGLGGRTTVFEDPIEEDKSGKAYLQQCLHSHKPIDLIIVMLGTNDLKIRFGLTAYDVSLGLETLVKKMRNEAFGADGRAPQILIIAPAPMREAPLSVALMGKEGVEKSRLLAGYYKQVAQTLGAWFLDAGQFVEVSEVDGIHYTPEAHYNLARAIEEKIDEMQL